ncbi:acyl-CoA dehydrogenase family protein [Mycolicibacterium sphagni]|uniref:acyl-CoA dehydrogenase family protein n=1 Tax=Mycolicibacterium sphagni TaxID=1786 RepID=UPI0013FDEF81|nr:acyl-CoA dehydrogenase family protein [Mycolicibacterium sphagni]
MPSPEQIELRAAARALMQEHSTSPQVRRISESDSYDWEVWRLVAQQMELPGLALPEWYGGSGAGLVELCITMEEMGRALFSSPYLATAVLAARLLLHSGDHDAQRELLPSLLSGERTATVAYSAAAGIGGDGDFQAHPGSTPGCWTVTGSDDIVLDACSADFVLVVATTEDGPTIFAADTSQAEIECLPREPFDRTRRLGRLRLDQACARMIGAPNQGRSTLARTLDESRIALAAEQLGAAQACLDTAVEYARARKQFGRPIGSFQAVQHKCADMLISIESARAAVDFASHYEVGDETELSVAAGIAAITASEALVHAASACIQVHGGMGFTWEHDAHLYLRRAKSSQHLFGGPNFHYARIAAAMS